MYLVFWVLQHKNMLFCILRNTAMLFVTIYMYMCSTVSAMKAKATRKKGRGVTEVDEGPTGGALRC